jgi:hypothetical protein
MLPHIHRATQKFYIFLIVYLTGCTPMTVRWSSFFVFFSNYFIDSFKIKFTAFLVAVSFLHKKYFYKYKIGVFR